MSPPDAQAEARSPAHRLTPILDELAHLLPAQGPISIFIHHNTLHAFEHLPFEDAVEQAASRLGREPFLPEARYRQKLASGRIRVRDVGAVLVEALWRGPYPPRGVAPPEARLGPHPRPRRRGCPC